MDEQPQQRRVARALRPGGPEVIEVATEPLPPLGAGEVLVRVEAAGLNHAETLIRSGSYSVRLPFPYPVGGEGAGVVVAVGPDTPLPAGTRVCWAAVLGSCANFVIAPASMLVPLPASLSFEQAASAAVAALTAGGLARVWPLRGREAVMWGAAGAVGRMLVALLAEQQVKVIGIASGQRTEAVRAAGALCVIDRSVEDVPAAVQSFTGGKGAAAVFDPMGAATYATSLQLLAPRGCLISYGELTGPLPAISPRDLFARSLFLTKYNGMSWIESLAEFPSLIASGLDLAVKNPALVSEVAGRFGLDAAADAYRLLESSPRGKVLVLPGL